MGRAAYLLWGIEAVTDYINGSPMMRSPAPYLRSTPTFTPMIQGRLGILVTFPRAEALLELH